MSDTVATQTKQITDDDLRPMSEMPEDLKNSDAAFLVRFKSDAFPDESRNNHHNGRWACVYHCGFTASGYDMGWGLPSLGGLRDELFVGWIGLAPSPAVTVQDAPSEAATAPAEGASPKRLRP